MARFRPLFLAPFVLATLTLPATAAVRLTSSVNGTVIEVEWPENAFPIRYRTDQRLLTALGGPRMIDHAFEAWASVPKGRVEFQSDGIGGGLRAGQDGQNVITLTDDLFANQRAIAVTTNWDVQGKLIESDIQIDASVIGGAYNVEQAVMHEVGHLLGLDHSGVLSAVMYPYVSRGNDGVELDSDDRVAIAAMYPEGDRTMLGGILRGRVTGDGGGVFAAQVVAVNERGEPVATGLTNPFGEFTLTGVPDGSYRIYAEPLDGPVETKNLSPYWRQTTAPSFPTQFHSGEPVQVVSGHFYGNLIVSTGGSAGLNPRWLGVSAPGSTEFKLTSTAVGVRTGQTIALAVAGDGFLPAVTTFEVMSPGIRRVSNFRYASNYVYADFEIAGDVPGGSAVILVRRGNETAALTGALRLHNLSSPQRGRIARR